MRDFKAEDQPGLVRGSTTAGSAWVRLKVGRTALREAHTQTDGKGSARLEHCPRRERIHLVLIIREAGLTASGDAGSSTDGPAHPRARRRHRSRGTPSRPAQAGTNSSVRPLPRGRRDEDGLMKLTVRIDHAQGSAGWAGWSTERCSWFWRSERRRRWHESGQEGRGTVRMPRLLETGAQGGSGLHGKMR